jgi:aspartyl-tRNA(Asn)/glutamyl-tRNA(Gln) amidotransferase subunit A
MNPLDRLDNQLGRIARLDGQVHAFLDLRAEEARDAAAASAERLERGEPLSAVDGLSIGVKANIAIAGLPHHAGIEAYRNRIAEKDAVAVRRLKEAGAIVLGTVNMHEGALGATTDNEAFGRTLNPWDEARTPGGSSGGSAAAVAAGFCDAALGSDTMGSVRIPSAYCGVQGFKPTKGAIPEDGVLALSPSLDHIGVHARRVDVAAKVFSVLAGRMEAEPASLRGLRLGHWFPEGEVEFEPAVADGFRSAIMTIEEQAGETRPVTPPLYDHGRSRRAGLLVSEREAAGIHAPMLKDRREGFSEIFRKMMAWGAEQPDDVAACAYRHIDDIAAAAPEAFRDHDLILAPVAPQTAFRWSDPVPANQADLTAWANLAGLPAAAVFTGLTDEGLPLSIQVIGPKGADDTVLAAAAELETMFGRPPPPPGFD